MYEVLEQKYSEGAKAEEVKEEEIEMKEKQEGVRPSEEVSERVG